MRELFYSVTSLEELFSKLDKIDVTPPVVEVGIWDALGRVLVEDFKSPVDVPHFRRAARDGYAVVAKDTFSAGEVNPVSLKVVGEVKAGDEQTPEVRDKTCVRVATGALIPEGADAVVMVEYTVEREGYVNVYKAVTPGENIVEAGRDIRKGEVLIRGGRVLSPQDVGAIAATGVGKVRVYGKLRVAVASTGDELIKLGDELRLGKIYDVNSVTLVNAIRASGGEPVYIGVLRDNKEMLVRALREALATCDVVVFSGGTSKGPGDAVPSALRELGPLDFMVHGLAMKPGKPTVVASYRGKPVFMLPGYPTSALLTYYVIVDPYIRKWSRLPPREGMKVKARAGVRIFSEEGRLEFKPVILRKEDDLKVYPTPTGSEAITTLSSSHGYIEIKANRSFIEQGEEVTVRLFRPIWEIDDFREETP
ncbi:MAG: molybdopterin-binding protein [Candidatus Jordarchaeales archaeon]|nr:molybdopterin molybdenumtransferase MoeA [Candidatus Jordarchaeia archaeon]